MHRVLYMKPLENSEQFLRIYDEFADAIFRHCYLRVSDRERAKELAQETFIRAWKYLSEGKKVDQMRALLYRMANNLIIDDYRKKKEASLEALQEGGFEPSHNPETKLHNIIEGKKIAEMLQKIESPYREAVMMRYIDDLNPKEIAEATGETQNVISVRINRGLSKLRQLLHE